MTPPVHRNVAVIGGGLSGLVTAYRLKTLGIDVVLLERSGQTGGVIQSEKIDGYLIERGPNSTQGTVEMLVLAEELGIMDELAEGDPRAPSFVWWEGKLHPVPMGLGALVGSTLISASGKLRLLTEPFRRRGRGEGEESVASFFGRRLGPQVARRLVAPFVSGIYAGDSSKLSVQAAFPTLAQLERDHGGLLRGGIAQFRGRKSKGATAQPVVPGPDAKPRPRRRRLCSFKDGMATLPRALSRYLDDNVLLDCKGISVAGDAGIGFRVAFEQSGVKQEITAEQLVIATPAQPASSLVRSLSKDLADLLAEIEYPPLAVVCAAYPESGIPGTLQGFGFLAVPGEGLKILGCVFNSCLFAGRAPEGHALVTVFVGGALNPALASESDSSVAATVHRDLATALGVTAEARIVTITRYQRAIPQYNIGHAARVAKIDSLVGALPGLWLTGNYLHGVSTGDCINHSEQLAQVIAGDVKKDSAEPGA